MVDKRIKNTLEQFVNNGGVLIAHLADNGWNKGIWNQSFLPGAPNLSHHQEYINYLSIVTNHNIVQLSNISNDHIDGWNYSAHGYFLNIPTNSIIVFGVEDDPINKPVYVIWRYGKGLVMATTMTIEWQYKYKDKYKMNTLLTSEIKYAISFTQERYMLTINAPDKVQTSLDYAVIPIAITNEDNQQLTYNIKISLNQNNSVYLTYGNQSNIINVFFVNTEQGMRYVSIKNNYIQPNTTLFHGILVTGSANTLLTIEVFVGNKVIYNKTIVIHTGSDVSYDYRLIYDDKIYEYSFHDIVAKNKGFITIPLSRIGKVYVKIAYNVIAAKDYDPRVYGFGFSNSEASSVYEEDVLKSKGSLFNALASGGTGAGIGIIVSMLFGLSLMPAIIFTVSLSIVVGVIGAFIPTKGLCYGMSVLSGFTYLGLTDISLKPGEIDNPRDTVVFNGENVRIVDIIAFYQGIQWSDLFGKVVYHYISPMSQKDLYLSLVNILSNNDLALLDLSSQYGAHAVIAYAVSDLYNDNAIVLLYDSNNPGKTMHFIINKHSDKQAIYYDIYHDIVYEVKGIKSIKDIYNNILRPLADQLIIFIDPVDNFEIKKMNGTALNITMYPRYSGEDYEILILPRDYYNIILEGNNYNLYIIYSDSNNIFMLTNISTVGDFGIDNINITNDGRISIELSKNKKLDIKSIVGILNFENKIVEKTDLVLINYTSEMIIKLKPIIDGKYPYPIIKLSVDIDKDGESDYETEVIGSRTLTRNDIINKIRTKTKNPIQTNISKQQILNATDSVQSKETITMNREVTSKTTDTSIISLFQELSKIKNIIIILGVILVVVLGVVIMYLLKKK